MCTVCIDNAATGQYFVTLTHKRVVVHEPVETLRPQSKAAHYLSRLYNLARISDSTTLHQVDDAIREHL